MATTLYQMSNQIMTIKLFIQWAIQQAVKGIEYCMMHRFTALSINGLLAFLEIILKWFIDLNTFKLYNKSQWTKNDLKWLVLHSHLEVFSKTERLRRSFFPQAITTNKRTLKPWNLETLKPWTFSFVHGIAHIVYYTDQVKANLKLIIWFFLHTIGYHSNVCGQ